MAVLRHLPLIQNWDCHQTGTCCKEYQVTISTEEKERIEAQGWDIQADLGGIAPIKTVGPPWRRRYQLNHTSDGSCVFLGDGGRCRIHERHGYATKPLPCRLFPFVLVPVADHWRVSLRFACPSVASNKGRTISAYDGDLRQFADQLAQREQVVAGSDGMLIQPPRLQAGLKVPWSDVLSIVKVLLEIINHQQEPIELRLRKCLTFAGEMRKANLRNLHDRDLNEFLVLMRGVADGETPRQPHGISQPGWVGRVLFRQIASLLLRKDHGPNRGTARQGRLSLLEAGWRFARGAGQVPRLHAAIPEVTFVDLEQPHPPLDTATEELLQRYYSIKISSMQFCGSAQFGLPLWEGLDLLLLTFPVAMWLFRMYRPQRSARDAMAQAMVIVDDHFGFNPMLASLRQRLGLNILSTTGELTRLIAWYSRAIAGQPIS